jgi:ectoine hydroxylase-related dioxygenase (phytanoyl-CoA dioxygenase family)/putative sterol carrier protein
MDTSTKSAQSSLRPVEVRAAAVSDAQLAASIAEAAATLATRAAFGGRIEVRLDEARGFVVDGPSGRVEPAGGPVDGRIQVAPKDLQRIAKGELEPRHALMFGQVQTQAGGTPLIVAFLDHLAGRPMTSRLETDRALPRPTRDWDRAREDLATFGYALVEGALSPEQVKALCERTVDQAAGEVEAGVATISGAAQHLWTLLNKGRVYHDLLLHPLIDAFVPDVVGPNFILNSITGSIALPGNAPSTMHIDQSNVQPAWRESPFGLNILWFLDDVTDANGGTRLMPGSHLADIAPADPFDPTDTVAAEGPAGTALLLDSRVWHSVGRNSTDKRRHVLVTYFNRSFMRAHENHFLSLRPELLPTMDEKVQVMLGYRCTLGLGATEEPVEGRMNHRLTAPVGELSPGVASDHPLPARDPAVVAGGKATGNTRSLASKPADVGEAEVAATRTAIDAILRQRGAFADCVAVLLDEARGFVIDGPRQATAPLDGEADTRVFATPRDLLRVAKGEMDPRMAILFGQLQVKDGAMSTAVALGDHLAGRVTTSEPPELGPLPTATTDRRQAQRDLETFGYALVKDALTPEQVTVLRERVIDQAAGEREHGVASVGPGVQSVWNLLNKGRVFHDLLLHPLIEAFVPRALGEHPVLTGIVSIIATPGGGSTTLHVDQAYVQPPVSFQIGLNILWFLEDVSDANGGTRILPGSHRSGVAPADPSSPEGTIAAEGPAGTALLLDSRVWHATGINRTDAPRHAVVSYFNRSFMRTKENYFLSMRPEVEASLDDRVRIMCGYRCTASVGGVEGPAEGKLYTRPTSLVGELSPTPPAAE